MACVFSQYAVKLYFCDQYRDILFYFSFRFQAFSNTVFFWLHAVFYTQQGKQRTPWNLLLRHYVPFKTFRSPLQAEFWLRCVEYSIIMHKYINFTVFCIKKDRQNLSLVTASSASQLLHLSIFIFLRSMEIYILVFSSSYSCFIHRLDPYIFLSL